jgi:hypothetical protein
MAGGIPELFEIGISPLQLLISLSKGRFSFFALGDVADQAEHQPRHPGNRFTGYRKPPYGAIRCSFNAAIDIPFRAIAQAPLEEPIHVFPIFWNDVLQEPRVGPFGRRFVISENRVVPRGMTDIPASQV